ncbi:LacI family transcriptional regulator [Actinoplanes italicus]|uniref:DNA-binding LacI/PurR family transcriptional regulator n=1 Tax=Actinoplanes italicus TaxID=113567 RepID=A0A2T0KC50_9ACTN|nr:substrate-binding domain-containing protein [Actinoplanes italicus]PRX20822.1 DNA-binding LacI/PurR family transcriptional regulator [Actinoplanes italicus]GIE31298.1 LacI family transcriptional regulator [Actinoplanes italicus]
MLIGLVLTAGDARVGVEPFFLELTAGLDEVLAGRAGSVFLLVVADAAAERDTYRRWAAQRSVAAVVLVNLVHGDDRPDLLAELGLPALLAGRREGAYPAVVTDDGRALTAALDVLHDLGHRVVGRVSGPAALAHTAERGAAAAAHRLTVHVTEGDYSAASGVRGLRALLAADPPPTAVVFDNDVMAVAAARELAREGIPVPGRLSLVAGNDSPLCELATPPLSALGTDAHAFGRVLGETVLAVLDGGPPPVRPAPPARVRLRESTARPAEAPRGSGDR